VGFCLKQMTPLNSRGPTALARRFTFEELATFSSIICSRQTFRIPSEEKDQVQPVGASPAPVVASGVCGYKMLSYIEHPHAHQGCGSL
jgi:hypothetical protein